MKNDNDTKDYKSKYYCYKRKYLALKKDLDGGEQDEPINIKLYIASFKKLSNSKGPCYTFTTKSNVDKFNKMKLTDAEKVIDKNLWTQYIKFDPEYENKTFEDIRGDYKCKTVSEKVKSAANKFKNKTKEIANKASQVANNAAEIAGTTSDLIIEGSKHAKILSDSVKIVGSELGYDIPTQRLDKVINTATKAGTKIGNAGRVVNTVRYNVAYNR
jgi:hypothetical protein